MEEFAHLDVHPLKFTSIGQGFVKILSPIFNFSDLPEDMDTFLGGKKFISPDGIPLNIIKYTIKMP